MFGVGTPKSEWLRIPVPAFLVRHPERRRDPRRHRPPPVGRHRSPPRTSVARSPASPTPALEPGGRARCAAARPRRRPEGDPARRHDPPALRPHLGDVRVPGRHVRRQRDASGRPPGGRRPLLNGYRHAQYDYAFDYRTVSYDSDAVELLRELRPHLRPLRRRLVRLASTPGPQRRPPVGDLPAARPATSSSAATPSTRSPSSRTPRSRRDPRTATTGGARCGSCARFREQFPNAVITAGHDPEQWPTLDARYE